MRTFFSFFIFLIFIVFSYIKISAAEPLNAAYFGPDGPVPSQLAYEATAIISVPELSSPQDLFVDSDGYLYVADASGRIVIFDPSYNLFRIIGEEHLRRPTGVTVNIDGHVLVADSENIFIFDKDGALINTFGRPESRLFGQTAPFRPLKLDTDARGNIYIVGEASVDGLIVLNADGEFLNYFGANEVSLTLFQTLQNIFTPRERRQFLVQPIPPTNVAISQRGAVFTVTSGDLLLNAQKLNARGANIFYNWASSLSIDIAMANSGGFFILASDGTIIEYDAEGNILYLFGVVDHATQRMGVFRSPTAIVQDKDNALLIADGESGIIHYFSPTEFAHWINQATSYFDAGMYVDSISYWEEVLRFQSGFQMAHAAIGHARFLQEDFVGAMESFYVAGFRGSYSEAFWELRNEWILRNAAWLIVALIAFGFGLRFLKKIPAPKNKLLKELAFIGRVLKNPSDAFYDMRFHGAASVRSACVLYAALFAAFLIFILGPGFIFEYYFYVESVPLAAAVFILGVALFVCVNYLVAAVNDGEGSFKNVFIGTAYSVAPFILMAAPLTLLSRVLTFNEAFVYTFLFQASLVYSAILLFIMLNVTHDYRIRDVIKNIALTIFTSAAIALVVFILYLLWAQAIDFFAALFWEASGRV